MGGVSNDQLLADLYEFNLGVSVVAKNLDEKLMRHRGEKVEADQD